MTATDEITTTKRKPRIALMGEFSAGKSTLSNLLLGVKALPEKVTATRLPPVWITYGDTPAFSENINGKTSSISLSNLEDISVEETRAIHLSFKSDLLQICDIIDFPGISDPNMSADVWQRMLPEVDCILWCTHATQAWRQSEAAVWDTIPQAIRDKSILLVTRFDKLVSEKDRSRVMRRLEMETEGLFMARFPISLLQAIEAEDDFDLWVSSGANDFINCMIDLVLNYENTQDGGRA